MKTKVRMIHLFIIVLFLFLLMICVSIGVKSQSDLYIPLSKAEIIKKIPQFIIECKKENFKLGKNNELFDGMVKERILFSNDGNLQIIQKVEKTPGLNETILIKSNGTRWEYENGKYSERIDDKDQWKKYYVIYALTVCCNTANKIFELNEVCPINNI